MTDLPNLQDIKADLADRKARGWSVQQGEALVAALEAVIKLIDQHPETGTGNIRNAINQHLTIGETK